MINRIAKSKLSESKGEGMRLVNKWIILTVLAVFFGSGSALCADVAKIGVVEFQRLFENSDAGKEIKTKITTQGKKMEAELKDAKKQAETDGEATSESTEYLICKCG